MKIKAVCQATGLTDRTVRYYIEEKLLLPDYTENYLGRKTFDFSEEDIQRLQDIAVLRKYGFTVAEIREMSQNPQTIPQTVDALRERKTAELQKEQTLLEALQLLAKDQLSISALAASLSTPASLIHPKKEHSAKFVLRTVQDWFWRILHIAMIAVPVVLVAVVIITTLRHIRYPTFTWRYWIIVLLALFPSCFLFLALRFRARVRRAWVILFVLFYLFTTEYQMFFLSLGGTPSRTDYRWDYRKFDTNCQANWDSTFQDLFPTQVYPVPSDYYYCFDDGFFGDTIDIYARWDQQSSESISAEAERIRELFASAAAEGKYTFLTSEHGDYTYLSLYSGSKPFSEVEEDSVHYIFAYSEERRTVRYLYYLTEVSSADQPYYLSLDWS